MTASTSLKEYSDCILPFLIHESHIRGRIVRLGAVVDTILTRHDYPEAVSEQLAELIVLSAMLSSKLKSQGVLTVQIKGEGPITMMVVDAIAGGGLRGYAEFEKSEAITILSAAGKEKLSLSDLFGKGYLVITLDAGKGRPPYQGIVELVGHSLSEAIEGYFTTSDQTAVMVRTSVGRQGAAKASHWCAGGIMLQHIPHEGGVRVQGSNTLHYEEGHDPREQWSRTCMFTETVTDHELLDPLLPPQELLYRLFNEDGVWVYEPDQLSVSCRCSREKIEGTLSQFPREDIADMLVDGELSVSCQFCNKVEIFHEDEVARLCQSENRP